MSFLPSAWVAAAGIAFASIVMPASAAPVQLQPFKDDLFAYPAESGSRDGGDATDVAYSEMRDINGRDEVPERRVKAAYVDPAPLRSQIEAVVETAAGPLKTMQVGERGAPKAVVVFIHGRNGDRRLGMYDRTFGGNFNRLKNLMARAGGLYATADAGTFGDADKARVAAFVAQLAAKPNRPPLVLACASMGGEFCWDLLHRRDIAADVAGIVMLSANNVPAKVEAMRQAAGVRRIPLVLAHGTRDKVFAWEATERLYERLHGTGYPVRFVSMTDGNHGTPIRMIDWRATLNWLFAEAG
jgi:pimeloyl-ACP methyl ester carboxylesterase